MKELEHMLMQRNDHSGRNMSPPVGACDERFRVNASRD